MAIRFLFGAGEAGAFPNIARSFSRVVSAARARAGERRACFSGSRVGGMLSVPIALLLIRAWGWRSSFVAFGSVGLVWAAAWYAWYRDRPADHPGVERRGAARGFEQDGPRAIRRGVRTRRGARCLTSRNLYTICAMYFAFGYGLYFYFTWLPTYLIRELRLLAARRRPVRGAAVSARRHRRRRRRLDDRWLARRHGLRIARCGLGCCAFATCAALLIGVDARRPAGGARRCCWRWRWRRRTSRSARAGRCCLDIGADHAGVVTGFMNTFGNLGGLVGPLVVGLAVDRWQSWTFPFYITAAVYAVGAMAWLAIDPARPIRGR